MILGSFYRKLTTLSNSIALSFFLFVVYVLHG